MRSNPRVALGINAATVPKRKIFQTPDYGQVKRKNGREKALSARYKAPEPNPTDEPLERNYDLSSSRGEAQKAEDRVQNREVRGQPSMDNV